MKFRRKNIKGILMSLVLGGVMMITIFGGEHRIAYATEATTVTKESNTIVTVADRYITDDDRGDADAEMLYYMQSLEIRYDLNQKQKQNLHHAFDAAVYYIANTEMTVTELWSYVASAKSTMESAAVGAITKPTTEFLQVADNWVTPETSYGQQVSVVLPIMNLGTEELNDLIVEPVTSNEVTKWPFEPGQSSFVQTEPFIPGNKTKEAAFENRREFTFVFTTREDCMTGYYPLEFSISYTKAGVRCEEPELLTVYIKTTGKPENGVIGGTGAEASGAKPRIIVTGFETNPEKVYAGETFTLTIHVKNTSNDTPVTNVLFDMQAAQEGKDNATTYAAFLPTSGASSVYMNRIGANTESDIVIEMTAKADLSQKPYVLNVNMKYDAGRMFDLADTASVSVPIYQESRFDISTPEVVPAEITTGSQSNVMFSIYNTGKTSLYNTQVKFIADSIEEASAFVGNLQSGATGNVDVMLTGIAPSMDDGTVTIEISYENEAGEITTVQKSITLLVSEPYYEEVYDPMMDEPVEEKKSPVIGIVVAVFVILAIGGGLFFYHKRKQKIALQKEQEELDAISGSIEDEQQ